MKILVSLLLSFGLMGTGPAQAKTPIALAEAALPQGLIETSIVVGTGETQVNGKITLPAVGDSLPAVVLVHGSGPGTMDLNVGGSTIFRDIAWGLARRGVAVIRYEKRPTAHPEYFARRGSPPTLDEEFRDDAVAAIMLLAQNPRVDRSQLYVLGHSLGGTVAPGIANRVGLAGAISAASSPRNLGHVIMEQAERVLNQPGTDEAAEARALEVRENGKRILAINDASDPAEIIHGQTVAGWRDQASARPLDEIERLAARGGRALIVHGERDYLVAEADWQAWTEALGGRERVTLRAYPTLNHLLQEGEGQMTPQEYHWTRPVADVWISDVADWIRNQS